MDELRRIERLARELPLRAVTLSPARLRLPLDDARCYPLYARCVELGLALVASVGVPAERVPFAPQKLERVDPVACHFPELRLVLRDGAEPWQALAVLLLRRHPNLSYAANLPPREVPPEIVAFANDDGAHQLLFASGPARERSFKELADLDLARPVWPRFLRDNAVRVFRL
jgi:predicted TIM-barrel fold metal-dependent hydrolase